MDYIQTVRKIPIQQNKHKYREKKQKRNIIHNSPYIAIYRETKEIEKEIKRILISV